MSPVLLHSIEKALILAMQVSVVIPMAVVWLRKRHFSPAVRLLSWYVYFSVVCAVCVRLGATYLHNNLWALIGFNMGKMLLFMAVYRIVMPKYRNVLQWSVAVAFVIICCTFYNMQLAIEVARISQCAVLAGFALLYLDHYLSSASAEPPFRNSLCLLSVGQLLYSAGTVCSFSITLLFHPDDNPEEVLPSAIIYIFIALSGLVFNYFLTLAFLRAQLQDEKPRTVMPQAVAGQVAGI